MWWGSPLTSLEGPLLSHWLNMGRGSKTKAEITVCKELLYFSSLIKIDTLQVYGDSKCIIDCISRINNLKVLNLYHWKYKISIVKENIIFVSFQHIYRECNKQANMLSNKALNVEEGFIFFEGTQGNHLMNSGRILICTGQQLQILSSF